MPNELDDLDQRLKAALTSQDMARLDARIDTEDDLPSMVRGALAGGMRHWMWITWIFSFVLAIAAIYVGKQAVEADASREQILYAAGFVVLWVSIGHIKIFGWMEMYRANQQRDLKRLELALLAVSRHLVAPDAGPSSEA